MANITTSSVISAREVNQAVTTIDPLIIQILTSLIVLFLGLIIGRIIFKLLLKIFDMIEFNDLFKKFTGWKHNASRTFASIVAYCIYIIGIVMSLNKLGITKAVINIIIIILLILLAVSIIFGTNDLFLNFFSGIIVRMRHNFENGKNITVVDEEKIIKGKIVGMNLLGIRIQKSKGEIVVIPSTKLLKSKISG